MIVVLDIVRKVMRKPEWSAIDKLHNAVEEPTMFFSLYNRSCLFLYTDESTYQPLTEESIV